MAICSASRTAERLYRRGRARWQGPLIELILPLAPAELNRGLGHIAWPKHNTAHLKQLGDILF